MTYPRPFLKWVGGKGQLLGPLVDRVPSHFGRYLEPFIGGGALFFRLRPRRPILGDVNPELVDCYLAVRDVVEAVIAELDRHVYHPDHYAEVRQQRPGQLEPPARAARTIYLNRCGFNGLYRVNKRGGFNVPFGRYKNPLICDGDNLRACSAVLRRAEIRCCPALELLDLAAPRDFAYLDPPYVPASETADFVGYTAGGFGPGDQQALAEALVELDRRGVAFTLSNADAEGVVGMYRRLAVPGLRIERVRAARAINSDPGGRGDVPELLVTNRRAA